MYRLSKVAIAVTQSLHPQAPKEYLERRAMFERVAQFIYNKLYNDGVSQHGK